MQPKCPTDRGKCTKAECRHSLPRGGCVLQVVAAFPDGLSQVAIAALFGVTRQRIEQVEREALAKLLKCHGARLRRDA